VTLPIFIFINNLERGVVYMQSVVVYYKHLWRPDNWVVHSRCWQQSQLFRPKSIPKFPTAFTSLLFSPLYSIEPHNTCNSSLRAPCPSHSCLVCGNLFLSVSSPITFLTHSSQSACVPKPVYNATLSSNARCSISHQSSSGKDIV